MSKVTLTIIAPGAFLIGTVVGCVVPTPSSLPTSSPIAIASTEPSPTEPPATPNGTISIGCFLAVQFILEDFRGLEEQINAFPLSQQKDVLDAYVGQIEATVVGAPVGCFTDPELVAFESFWDYLSSTRARELKKGRIEELMSATGFPYPTAHP